MLCSKIFPKINTSPASILSLTHQCFCSLFVSTPFQAYPNRDITNIVESSHYQKIGGWCRQGALNANKCKGAHRWIKPFRCLGKSNSLWMLHCCVRRGYIHACIHTYIWDLCVCVCLWTLFIKRELLNAWHGGMPCVPRLALLKQIESENKWQKTIKAYPTNYPHLPFEQCKWFVYDLMFIWVCVLLSEGPFQSDALLVPEGCLFDHIHNASRCWPFVRWNQTGAAACQERGMQMRSFAMLLPCGISLFSGVEFVCCPKHFKSE